MAEQRIAQAPQWLLDRFVEPIVVLEMRRFWRRGLRPFVLPLVLIAVLAVTSMKYWPRELTANALLRITAHFCLIVTIILVSTHAWRAAKREKETGVWDMLAMSSMTSRQIADQKIVAALIPAVPALSLGLALAVAAVLRTGVSVAAVGAIWMMWLMVATSAGAFALDVAIYRTPSGRVLFFSGTVACMVFVAFYLASFLPLTMSDRATAKAFCSDVGDLRGVLRTGCYWALAIAVLSLIGARRRLGRLRTWLGLTVSLAMPVVVLAVPAVQIGVSHVVAHAVSYLSMIITPTAAIAELTGRCPHSLLVMLPRWMPAYSITFGTLAVQILAIVWFRKSATRSVERSRRLS